MAQRKPKRSLRTLLSLWFILFSIGPLMFITTYSILKYKKALDNELQHRLTNNAREIKSILNDINNEARFKREKFLKNQSLAYALAEEEIPNLKESLNNFIKNDSSTMDTFFDNDGKMIISAFKDKNGEVQNTVPSTRTSIYLSDENLSKLKNQSSYSLIEYNHEKISLIEFSKVINKNELVGYFEQVIDLDTDFALKLKKRMQIEVIFLHPNGQPVLGTNSDFMLYDKDFFYKEIAAKSDSYFELKIRDNPHEFIIDSVPWSNTSFFVAIGASKLAANSVLKNINYAFITAILGTLVVLLILIFFASRSILKPIDDLVAATEKLQVSEKHMEIAIKSDNELGLLTESFNRLSRSIIRAREELKHKITELEQTNDELKATQSKLVHSSKMMSLGQLVAGVAHELNNPIGFIYSNMTHLEDYANKLLKLTEAAEHNSEQLAKIKIEIDLDYIKKDLPKLVASCKEGARRTRDIVLGLRNFSRLEEAKETVVDINKCIDDTLSLVSGELKNKVQVHKDYGTLPPLKCYATQINQVFMNILSNSAQAIEGKGNIWITTRLTKENQIRIVLQDSGKGMSPETLEKIFDPFYSTKEIGQGTGLGLSITYGIIQNHGGEITVKSQEGSGTAFTILLPVDGPAKS